MAKKPQGTKSEAKPALVAVTKDGETIHVHPTQVEQHARLGWRVA